MKWRMIISHLLPELKDFHFDNNRDLKQASNKRIFNLRKQQKFSQANILLLKNMKKDIITNISKRILYHNLIA